MSKKHGASKKRKKRARKLRRAGTPQALLDAVAEALNSADAAGLKVRLRHGAVFCAEGVVLPPERKGGRWVARTLRRHPAAPAGEADDLDD